MSDPAPAHPAISMRGIGKTYRLYRKPGYRVLDLFGLCPTGPAYYGEHAALQGIDLNIARGEKVAIIGRNGAGKSTLLKIITGTIQPSAGEMAINGTVSALLQVGTGFHPDFTGRQNVYSALAHQGITGARAHQLFEEIVDFAELHEYIDQAVKTYSTGMGARLMFSANTILSPDILVIDELLGVGDAYFAHKSYERMRRMCSDSGTTLLLVTHDLYTALNLCERFVWIDKGRMLMDCDGKTALSAYEKSIKEQEEERLRRQHERVIAKANPGARRLTVEFASVSGFALSTPFAIGTLTLRAGGEPVGELAVAAGSPGWEADPQSNLGPPTVVADRRCRCLFSYGSVFHKVSWRVALPPDSRPDSLVASWQYAGMEGVEVRVLDEEGGQLLNARLEGNGLWQTTEHAFGRSVSRPAREQRDGGHYGTGLLRISGVHFLDAADQPCTRVAHGGTLTIAVDVERVNSQLEEATFVIGFHRPGIATGAYVNRDRLTLPPCQRFRVTAKSDQWLLGSGQWMISIGLAIPDHYHQPDHKYYTISDHWLHFIARGFELEVISSTPIDRYAFFLQTADVVALPAP